MKTLLRYVGSLLLCCCAALAVAEEGGNLSAQVEDIKRQTLELNRDLFILEEELLFPSDTQVAVYLSMHAGTLFALDAVKLSIDGVVVANYLYTERQVDALQRGGIHRLFRGNMKTGTHELVAVFTGRGPQGRDYRRATQLQFEKIAGARQLELLITDSQSKQQPEFSVRQW
ncbi:AraC family transcriptional regulator [Pseudohalioglobus sediminis]|uniref:AraC family transcriptional regulator n=1 Tax=Pseudohalioglobus sediminis TaxID=2606449 RepID=A0A5B0WZ93_9GAMM|nr:AraC family transcriptional regulator [Pseudohalioglobus sediminis]KAA1192390.1 AraC family transcriptional regulator [Pseudohalioglobus sediminis]